MLIKLPAFIRQQGLMEPGDQVVCAVSGGADSVALLFALYLLREKLQISLSAAHYNHGLRGEESDRDQAFVEALCSRYDIPLQVAKGKVIPGKKGLEAAAREARYAFLESLPGKIATAHTADDNAETVLMHLVRGTGLKGLGGIAPVRGRIIRPMLSVTRQEVLAFLQEYCLQYVEDSSNAGNLFLRNRLRHSVMPLLKQENPKLAENISRMALRLRQDEQILQALTEGQLPPVAELRTMPQPVRRRHLTAFLERSGVREPETEHIELLEQLVFSRKPSAKASLPGGVTIVRVYDRLEVQTEQSSLPAREVTCPGVLELPDLRIHVRPADQPCLQYDRFTVMTKGTVVVRGRQPGDTMRLAGGTKTLKQLYIDRKLPAHCRSSNPVIADEQGVLGVYGIGANLDRTCGEGVPVEIWFEQTGRE